MTPPKSNQRSSTTKSRPTNSSPKKTGKAESIPNYLRRKVLNLIRDHPELSFKNLDVKIKNENGVKLSTREVFKVARRYLRCKLRDGILEKKLKREEIDHFINGWQFGKDMEFHRTRCEKEFEEGLWRIRNRMDVQEEDEQMEVDDGEEEDATNNAVERKISIPNYLRRKILNLIRDRRDLSFKDLDMKIENEDGVKLSTREVFKVARKSLIRKLKDGILVKKLKREEIDDFVNGWQFGKDMEFYRKGCEKEYEKGLWNKRKRMDKQAAVSANAGNMEDEQMEVDDGEQVDEMEEEDATNDAADYELLRSTNPCAIVISTKIQLDHEDRIKKIPMLMAEVPISCEEALRGQEHGSFTCPRKYPGIPNKKFSIEDLGQYGTDASVNWSIEVAIEKKGFPGTWLVLFEGWNYFMEYTEEGVEEAGSDTLNVAKIRAEFLKKLIDIGIDRDLVLKHMFSDGNEEEKSVFWDYQDLSYFHSRIQSEHGLAPVFYMALVDEEKENNAANSRTKKAKKQKVMPPKHTFTSTNIMVDDVYESCLGMDSNLDFETLKRQNGGINMNADHQHTACENPQGCVCNQRVSYFLKLQENYSKFSNLFFPIQFNLLYNDDNSPDEENLQNLQMKRDGLLDLNDFDWDHPRMVMECSDQCGCSFSCPRRQMQANRTKPTVVYYEGAKGNGLRAAASFKKGEYIGEYTGKLKKIRNGQNSSYQVDIAIMNVSMTICSLTHGNHTRFMSHSCEPSAAMIPTFSRRLETDPLLPRVSVYAIKDIGIGEEITISYYTKADMAKMKMAGKGIRCG
ncbi:unnamed protein product [Caenorhabditis brenneri]